MNQQLDLTDVDEIVAQIGRGQDSVIPILQALQKCFRYLPEDALRRVCEISEISLAIIQSVATFFPQFRAKPAGEHTICVCDGTACHLKGAPSVYDAIARELHLGQDEDTDKDGTFTVQKIRCLGCCTLAPAVQIDGVTYGHVSAKIVPQMLDDFLTHAAQTQQSVQIKDRPEGIAGAEIRIGLGSCCVAGGSEKIRAALDETRAAFNMNVRVKRVSCVGMCHQTPLLEILIPGQLPRLFAKVQPDDVPSIVLAHFPPRGAVSRVRVATVRWLDRFYVHEADNLIEHR